MNLKTLSFTTIAMLAAAAPASAFFAAGFNVFKRYRQDSSGVPIFLNGNAGFYVVDGTFLMTAGCGLNGTGTQFPVDTEEGCNIGANGVLLSFSNDGTVFSPSYYEVTGIEPANTVDVGQYSLVKLYARPTLEYPMDDEATGFAESLFYDLQSITGDVREYRFGQYQSFRTYLDRRQMEREIVEGVYTFSFPSLNNSSRPLYLNFPVRNTVEGYVKDPIRGGFRFVDVPGYAGGFAEFDARLPNTFRWEGLTGDVILASDRLYIGFQHLPDAALPTDEGEGYVFPPGIRARLPSPIQNTYTLPPGFFRNVGAPFSANRTKAVLELTVERGNPIGLTLSSTRVFELPIIFVDSFAGAMSTAFPESTPTASLARGADPDADGIPNWIEWLSSTNPNKANAPKTLSSMSFVPPSAAKDGEPSAGYWQMTMDRPASLPSQARLDVESSTDLKTWTTISNNDPQWEVINNDNEPQIRVISKTPGLTEKRYFRVRFVDNTGG